MDIQAVSSFVVWKVCNYSVHSLIDAFFTYFRLLVVVCLAAYAAGQGFRKKTSGPTTPATVQKQVAAGVSLFVCLHFIAKPEVKVTKVLGPTTLATVKKQVVAGGESFLFYISLLIHIKVLGPQLSPLYRNSWQ